MKELWMEGNKEENKFLSLFKEEVVVITKKFLRQINTMDEKPNTTYYQ